MDNDYTHITLVVDRSGSMQNIRTDAQGGINNFVKTNKEAPGRATFYLAQFDDHHEDVFGPADIQGFTSYELVPRGMTAMLDAIGKGLVTTGEYLAKMPEAERPGKVLFVIVTDGAENASKEYTWGKVKAMTDEQTNTYGWEFVFLAANIDAAKVGQMMGVNNAANYQPTGASMGATMDHMATRSRVYRGAGPQARMGKMPDVDADGNVIPEPVTAP